MNYLWKSSICASVLAAAGVLAATSPQAQDAPGKPLPQEPKPAAEGTGDAAAPLVGTETASPQVQDAPAKPKPEASKPVVTGKAGSAAAPFLIDELNSDAGVTGSDWPVRFRKLTNLSAQNEYAAALAAYGAAAQGQDKESAKAAVRKQLAEIFEADMKSRKEQADQIDARLKKLREQYQAREAAKDSIIDLQLQVLEKDAGGLGFPFAPKPEYPSYEEGSRRYPLLHYPTRRESGQLIPDESSNVSRRARQASVDQTQKLPLESLKKAQPALIDELTKAGHFIESPDGKFYAYANVNHPSGPSEILAVEAQTGKLLAIWSHPSRVIGRLILSNEDILTQNEDGSTTPIIRHAAFASELSGKSSEATRHSRSESSPASETAAQGSAFADYQSLRSQYLNAKIQLLTEDHIKSAMDREKNQRGDEFTVEKAKDRLETLKIFAARQQAQFDEAARVLEVKLRLLKLDVEQATLALQEAESKLQSAEQINATKPGAVNDGELQSLKLKLRTQQLQIERAKTVLALFESIKSQTTADTSATRSR
jgi:hypothetical protein